MFADDEDDALSTLHDVGIEEDLENAELQDGLKIQTEVIELTD